MRGEKQLFSFKDRWGGYSPSCPARPASRQAGQKQGSQTYSFANCIQYIQTIFAKIKTESEIYIFEGKMSIEHWGILWEGGLGEVGGEGRGGFALKRQLSSSDTPPFIISTSEQPGTTWGPSNAFSKCPWKHLLWKNQESSLLGFLLVFCLRIYVLVHCAWACAYVLHILYECILHKE
jgi:hypothetical protein